MFERDGAAIAEVEAAAIATGSASLQDEGGARPSHCSCIRGRAATNHHMGNIRPSFTDEVQVGRCDAARRPQARTMMRMPAGIRQQPLASARPCSRQDRGTFVSRRTLRPPVCQVRLRAVRHQCQSELQALGFCVRRRRAKWADTCLLCSSESRVYIMSMKAVKAPPLTAAEIRRA